MSFLKHRYFNSIFLITIALCALYYIFMPKADQYVHTNITLEEMTDNERITSISWKDLTEKITKEKDVVAYIQHPSCFDIKSINETLSNYLNNNTINKTLYVVDLSAEKGISIVNNNSCKYLLTPLYINDLSIYQTPTLIHFKDNKLVSRHSLIPSDDVLTLLKTALEN